jgi:hypothetical protein
MLKYADEETESSSIFILLMHTVEGMHIKLERDSEIVSSRANIVQKRHFEVHVESHRRN